MSPEEIVLTFNDCINNRGLGGLSRLMTEDHLFIDTENNIQKGKKRMVNAWDDFFQQFPDYQNHFSEIISRDEQVFIIGHSICSEQALDGPALWRAKVENNLVKEWQVYIDTPENRKKLNL